jgi:transcriptional regulator with GAF, ATPase, and Fis domain
VHGLSQRCDRPFVVVDCAAIPHDLIESELFGHRRGAFSGATSDRLGAFEEANSGTLFLDEIGELPLALQPKLLRVLETGTFRPLGLPQDITVDVRIIAASLRNLAEEVRAGRFRGDLYYRLAVVMIQAPPLRDHLTDLPVLAAAILSDLGAPPLGAQDLQTLASYAWPGNVRQLRNVLEQAAATARGGRLTIRREDLEKEPPPPFDSDLLKMPFREAKAGFTREYLVALLERHRGNVSAAAREAGLDRNWVTALAKRHGLKIRN